MSAAQQPTPTYADLHAMFWHEFVAKHEVGYQPRLPAESTQGLVPVTGHGYCMTPIIKHGTRMWFDRSLAPESGDVVTAQFHPTVIERTLRDRANDADFQRAYGDEAKRGELGRVIKLLCSYRGVPFLVTNDSMVPLNGGKYGAGPPLGPSKIIGVLRRIDA